MKTDGREPSARDERIERTGKAKLQLSELVVDEHAQRLKSAGRRVLAGFARAHRFGHDGRQLRSARQGARASCGDDGLRHATCEALLPEPGDHLAYLVDARTSEPGSDGLPPRRVHAHIERTVGAEAEATLCVIKLR